MIPIKVQCPCGQHYSFDVEPLDGKMPSTVACPACGADGTSSANEQIAKHLAPAPHPHSSNPSLRLAVAVPAAQPPGAPVPSRPVRPDPRLGLVGRAQAEHEARAKVMWGDSRQQIVSYLMIQGFSNEDATDLAQQLFKERAAAVRSTGMRKIIVGIGLMCLMVIALVFILFIGFFLKLVILAVMGGLYGLWEFLNGILMVVAPKSEKGDLADK